MSWNAVVVMRTGSTNPSTSSLVLQGFLTEALALAAGKKVVEAKKMIVSNLGEASYSTGADQVVGKPIECYVTAVEVA